MSFYDFTDDTRTRWGLDDPDREDAALEPTPGLWAGMTDGEYHRLPGLSASRIKELMRSPAHLQAALGTPHESTDAQRFGTAAHLAVLEPERFNARVIETPEINRRTNAGKAEWAELVDRHGADNMFKPDDFAHLKAIQDAAHSHPVAGELLSDGAAESTAVWHDVADFYAGDDGDPARQAEVLSKARVDWYDPARGLLVDLKTTRDGGADSFAGDFYRFGYFRQLAYYRHALRVLSLPVDRVLVLAVEKVAPYAVSIFEPDEMALNAGMRQVEGAIDLYAECLVTGDWPGYPTQPQPLDIPHWAYNRL